MLAIIGVNLLIMKRISFFGAVVCALFAVAAAVSCQSGRTNVPVPSSAEPVFTADSVSGRAGAVSYSIRTDFPSDTLGLLSRAVAEYVSESLGGSYEGSFCDVKSVLGYYASVLDKTYSSMYDDDEFSSYYYIKIDIRKYAEGRDFVTFIVEKMFYLGGAHGSHGVTGMTFRKSDGRRIGWDLFTGRYEEDFSTLLREGLCRYWNLGSSDELMSYLFDRDDFYSVPFPQCPPLFTAEGVEFVYNEYEIAAFALGTPRFVIPYDSLDKYMRVTARRLL